MLTRTALKAAMAALLLAKLSAPVVAADMPGVTATEIPQAFIVTGATRFTDYKEYPFITTGLPSYDTESRAYARYIAKEFS